MLVPLQQIMHFFAAEGGIATLGVNVKSLVLQAISFLLVFWLLKRFAFGKVVNVLEERRQTIDKGVTLGREMEDEKNKLEERIEKKLREARQRADDIIAKANQEAGEVVKEAEAVAARKTDAMIADAHARIEDDINRARRDLESDLLELVAEATGVIIGDKLDEQKDNALIQKAISGVKSE